MRQKSIRQILNRLVVLPVICLGVIILALSIWFIYGAIVTETEDGLKNLSHALMEKCNVMAEGDYSLQDGILYKGDVSLENNEEIVDSVKKVSGVDATIFWNDIRVQTTIRSEEGKRIIGTKASKEVTDRVLKNGEEYFFSHIQIDESYYYGYYIPMKNSDGSIVGMIFVGKSSKLMVNTILHMVFWISAVVISIIIVGMVLSLKYAGEMVYSLTEIRKFLENVSQGDLECRIDERLLARKDELGEMGRFAQRLQTSILKLIGTDPLTGLYNRRSCNEALEKAVEEYKKDGKKCIIVIGDIDDFKRLNDTYGHLAGDQVLKVLSEVLMKHMEGKGIAARWGGEEFMLIYKEGEPEEEVEQMLQKIRETRISYKNHIMQVTMTFGISVFRPDDTIEAVIKRADERLYWGKENGKNQVVRIPK